MRAHLLAPAGFEAEPSGGNVYDRHLRDQLAARGWEVVVHEATPESVGAAVPDLPDGATMLVDGLVASWAPEVLLAAPLRVVPLVHMVFGVPGERDVLAQAPAVVTTSESTRRRLVLDGLDPRRVHVATPGVERVLPAPIGEAGDRLLCVAALTPAKGQDVLLAALARLTDLEWSLTLGGPADRDPAYVDLLRKQAADAGITDRVRFAGALSRDEVHAALLAADLAVLPSRAETYGMVVTEALVHGRPVVATAVGGVPEALGTVNGARPGMLVRPDVPEALARSLRRWLEDPSLRQGLARVVAARRRTLPRWEATAARVAAVLEEVA